MTTTGMMGELREVGLSSLVKVFIRDNVNSWYLGQELVLGSWPSLQTVLGAENKQVSTLKLP